MNIGFIETRDKTLDIIGAVYLAALFIIRREGFVAMVGTVSFAILLWQFVRDEKRSTKRIIAMIVCLLTAIFCTVSMVKNAAPYRYFGEVCNKLFEQGSDCRVINDSEDMTDEFLAEHDGNYQNGKYEEIMGSLIDNRQMISWQEETDISAGKKQVKGYFYIAGRQDYYFPGNSFELIALIDGEYSYDNISGEILGHSAEISQENDYVQGGGKCRMNGISCYSETGQDKKTAVFTADFHLENGKNGTRINQDKYNLWMESRPK